MPKQVKHPGIVLVKPDATHARWRARYVDPETGKRVKVSLDSALTTSEDRAKWAKLHLEKLKNRRRDLVLGAVPESSSDLAASVKRFYAAHTNLRPKTREIYGYASNRFLKWAASEQITSCDQIDRAKLLEFRATLVNDLRTQPAKAGKRGARTKTGKTRKAVSINQDLRSIHTIIVYLLDLNLFAHLRFDDLRRALKKLPVTRERIKFLKPAEITRLLHACEKHDAVTFDETRIDHKNGTRSTTPRYTAIRPFVLLCLLTGMRLNEAAKLQWSSVDLDAAEIHLRGEDTKTKRERTVDLSISPLLVTMLAAMNKKRKTGPVFQLTPGEIEAAEKRLVARFDAPEHFSWQVLRSTCGTYLTNAPGIFGASSAYRSAKQLGHSVTVAEKHYLGLEKSIPKNAATVEAAMGLA